MAASAVAAELFKYTFSPSDRHGGLLDETRRPSNVLHLLIYIPAPPLLLQEGPVNYIPALIFLLQAARTSPANRGWGRLGRDLNSGCPCVPI